MAAMAAKQYAARCRAEAAKRGMVRRNKYGHPLCLKCDHPIYADWLCWTHYQAQTKESA